MSKSLILFYFKLMGFLSLIVVIFGVIAPALISAKSHELVFAGWLALMIAVPLLIALGFSAKKTFDVIIKHLEKESETK